jgi:hypothetical protein
MGDAVSSFVRGLVRAVERAPSLKRGDAFLPKHLKKWALSKTLFPPVMEALGTKLGWTLQPERTVTFPKDYEVGKYMRVDYVLHEGNVEKPKLYVELETLDRAQLYNFLPHRKPARDESKFWYYYGILANAPRCTRAPGTCSEGADFPPCIAR